jgi:hypothetical protein
MRYLHSLLVLSVIQMVVEGDYGQLESGFLDLGDRLHIVKLLLMLFIVLLADYFKRKVNNFPEVLILNASSL